MTKKMQTLTYKLKKQLSKVTDFYQKGMKGYCDKDLWNLDRSILTYIKNTVNDFSKLNLSMPTNSSKEAYRKKLARLVYLSTEVEDTINSSEYDSNLREFLILLYELLPTLRY